MKYRLERRLQALKAEFESGQKIMTDLETKQANLRDTLLRIAGAIQVLEELLQSQDDTVAATVSDVAIPPDLAMATSNHSDAFDPANGS